MTASRTLALLGCLVLVACAPLATEPRGASPAAEDAEPIGVIVDPELAGAESGLGAAWTGYGIAQVVKWSELESEGRARRLDDFAIELAGRRTLVELGRQLGLGGEDPYLDLLMDLDGRGFLEEYVITFFGHPGWTVPAESLADLQVREFLAFGSQHLEGHVPETRARAEGGPPAPEVPGAGLPDAEALLDPTGRPECGDAEQMFARARSWEQTAAQLPARAIAVDQGIELLYLLDLVGPDSDLHRTGVTLVPSRVAGHAFLAGFCAIEAGDYQSAERFLETAVSLRPGDPGLRLELAHAQTFRRKFDAVLDQVTRVLHTSDDPCIIARALRRRGYIEFEQGELRKAFATYRKSQEYEPQSPIARNELAALRQAMAEAGWQDLPPDTFTPPPTTQSATRCTLDPPES